MKTKANYLALFGILCLSLLFFISPARGAVETFSLDKYVITYIYDESDAIIGEQFSLSITITNQDTNTLEDIRFELQESYPFRIIGDDDLRTDSLDPGDSKSKTFVLKINDKAKRDKYNLYFDLEDDEDDYEEPLEIKVQSITPKIIVGNVQSLPTILSPDTKDIQLTLTLENIGEGNANFVRVKLDLPKGFKSSSSYSDTANLGTIGAGLGKSAIFFIDTEDYLSGISYNGKLLLKYEDENNEEKEETIEFDLPVKGKPIVEVLSNEVSSPLDTQTTGAELRIKIINVGSEDAKETSVRVFENSDIPFKFDEKTNFVGTLEKGQTGTAIFTFDVESGAKPNIYLLKVQTRTISNGIVLVDEKTLPIEVEAKETNILGIIFGIIIIIIILDVAYFLFKKFRKKKRTK